MAKHSKWHNIKHKKAASDAIKSKIYTKVAKLIEIAARSWSDPRLNPSLDTVLIKARANNLPKDVIERAIKKGSGATGGENFEEIYYEGYGPGGSAIYIKTLTPNKNRTSGNIRLLLTRGGANIWEPGSVSWQFKERGVFYITGEIEKKFEKGKDVEIEKPLDLEKLEENILEMEAEDFEEIDDGIRLITAKENFASTLKFLEANGYKLEEASIEFIPENYVSLGDEESAKLERLIENLEEDDDVDSVYHNAE